MLSCKLNDQVIFAFDYEKDTLKKWAKKDILLCPVCNRPYEYCHGRVRIPYFRHKDKVQCLEAYSEPETQEHLQGKIDLYNWLKTIDGIEELEMEAWIPSTKQKPDIKFVYQNKIYVVEYQCSPISTEYYERHDLYKAAGINDIWICGAEKYFQDFHKGKGDKRENVIENTYGLYYLSSEKLLCQIDERMKEDIIKSIEKNKMTDCYFMEEYTDYNKDFKNFYYVKSKNRNFKTETYYLSPTGRPSNKYPYPCTRYVFNINKAFAYCKNIFECSLNDIFDNKENRRLEDERISKLNEQQRIQKIEEEKRKFEEKHSVSKEQLFNILAKHIKKEYKIDAYSGENYIGVGNNGYFEVESFDEPYIFTFHKVFRRYTRGYWESSEYRKRKDIAQNNSNLLFAFTNFIDKTMEEIYINGRNKRTSV